MAYFLLSTLSISTMLQGIYQAFYKVPKKIVTRYKVRWPSTWLQLLPQPLSCITLMVLDGEIRRKHRQIKKVIPQNELKTDSEKENHVPLLSLIKEQWWKPSHVKKYYILFQHSSYTKPPLYSFFISLSQCCFKDSTWQTGGQSQYHFIENRLHLH